MTRTPMKEILFSTVFVLGIVSLSYSSTEPIELRNVAMGKDFKSAYFILQWNNPYPMPQHDTYDHLTVSLNLVITCKLDGFRIAFGIPTQTFLDQEIVANPTLWTFDRLGLW